MLPYNPSPEVSNSTLKVNLLIDRLAHWARAHIKLLTWSVFLEITVVVVFISTIPTQLFFKPTSCQRSNATLYTELHHLDRSSPKHLVLHKPGVIALMTSELYQSPNSGNDLQTCQIELAFP